MQALQGPRRHDPKARRAFVPYIRHHCHYNPPDYSEHGPKQQTLATSALARADSVPYCAAKQNPKKRSNYNTVVHKVSELLSVAQNYAPASRERKGNPPGPAPSGAEAAPARLPTCSSAVAPAKRTAARPNWRVWRASGAPGGAQPVALDQGLKMLRRPMRAWGGPGTLREPAFGASGPRAPVALPLPQFAPGFARSWG